MFSPPRDQTTPPGATFERELDCRTNDGIEVRLLWSEHDGTLRVAVSDGRAATEFSLEVRDRGRALDVFHHPYAYAAHYGVASSAKSAGVALESSVAV